MLSNLINNFINKLIKIVQVYFTPYPYLLYSNANNNGNLGLTGIGLGLIYCQKIFWINNICMIIILYNQNNIKFYFIQKIIFLSFIYLYLLTLSKTNYLLNKL